MKEKEIKQLVVDTLGQWVDEVTENRHRINRLQLRVDDLQEKEATKRPMDTVLPAILSYLDNLKNECNDYEVTNLGQSDHPDLVYMFRRLIQLARARFSEIESLRDKVRQLENDKRTLLESLGSKEQQ